MIYCPTETEQKNTQKNNPEQLQWSCALETGLLRPLPGNILPSFLQADFS